MTLTADRRVELLAGRALFADVDADGMERIAARAVEVDFPADHVIARQGEIGTGFFVIAERRRPGRSATARSSPGSARASSSGSCRCSTGGRASRRSSPTARRPASPSRRGTSRPSLREEPGVALAVVRGLARRLRDLTEGPPSLSRR